MFTYILLIINIIVFIMIRTGKLNSDDLASSYHLVFNRKQYYRIITSAFTHEDIIHILFNMMSLINIGSFVEDVFGSFRMLLIYFVSMILGKIFALYIRHNNRDDYTMTIGASGAICGILGTYFLFVLYVYGFNGFYSLLRPISSLLIMSMLPGVDATSHFCCMAVGMAISYLMIMF